jgi:20S proteasome alpha/beta subunit
MTVIVAARCADGAIMASDSQATEMVAGVRWDVQKVFPLTNHAVWGASGMVNIIDDVRGVLDADRDTLTRSPRLENSLHKTIQPILKRHYELWLPVPGMQSNPPATSFVACGVKERGDPFIIEIDSNCNCSVLDRDFHAIGSGAGFAQMAGALLEHFGLRDQPVDSGKRIVYRAIDAVVQTSHFGIGGDIQMWIVTQDRCRQLTPADIAELKDFVAGWKEIERDALDRAMGMPVEEEAPPPPEV